MAYPSYTNIRRAVRDRIEGLITDTRAVTAGRFDGDFWPNMSDDEKKRRANVVTRYDVMIRDLQPHPNGPFINNSVGLVKLLVTIITSYRLVNPARSDNDRDTTRATAEVDVDILRQALSWPGSLTDTAAAGTTGLVSGLLRWTGSRVTREEWGEGTAGAAGLLELEHGFEGIVQVTQAMS